MWKPSTSCTDSGREGEYIYRLVAQMAKVRGKQQKRARLTPRPIEILRQIRKARDLSVYDHQGDSAYLGPRRLPYGLKAFPGPVFEIPECRLVNNL